jgi:cytochrome c-type biogenesis protein CcmH/NrfG
MGEPTIEEVLVLLTERPNDAELYQQLGDLYFKQRTLKRAWESYMQSLRLNPDDPFTCLKFATLLQFCRDKTAALELFEHAIEVAPKLAVAHWCLANHYREEGEFDKAERAYERAVEVAPDDRHAQEKLTEWRAFSAGIRTAPYSPEPAAEQGSAGSRSDGDQLA